MRPIPQDEIPVPEYLKWDLWLGSLELRPYHRSWMQWHGWRKLGTVQLGNWAIHSSNMQFMAFKAYELWYDDSRPGRGTGA